MTGDLVYRPTRIAAVGSIMDTERRSPILRYTLDGVVQVLVEEAGEQEARYLYGLDLFAKQQDETTTYLGYDALSVRLHLDGDGAIAAQYRYGPFGEVVGEGPAGYGYTGEQWDHYIKMTFLRARYYQPEMGRFLSRDPWPGKLQWPASLNRYVYVANGPVSAVDPTGYCAPGATCPGDSLFNMPIVSAAGYDAVELVGLTTIPTVKEAGRDPTRIGIIRDIDYSYGGDFSTLGEPWSPRHALIVYHAQAVTLLDTAEGASHHYAQSSWNSISQEDLFARLVAQESGGDLPYMAFKEPPEKKRRATALRNWYTDMVGISQVVLRRYQEGMSAPSSYSPWVESGQERTIRSYLLGEGQFCFTLHDPKQDPRAAAENWSDPLGTQDQFKKQRYEGALKVVVGVMNGWLRDPRTITEVGFSGTGTRTKFNQAGVVEGYPGGKDYGNRPGPILK